MPDMTPAWAGAFTGRTGYPRGVRPRWPEYLIGICLLLIFAAGVASIWGEDIAGLFRSGDR